MAKAGVQVAFLRILQSAPPFSLCCKSRWRQKRWTTSVWRGMLHTCLLKCLAAALRAARVSSGCSSSNACACAQAHEAAIAAKWRKYHTLYKELQAVEQVRAPRLSCLTDCLV